MPAQVMRLTNIKCLELDEVNHSKNQTASVQLPVETDY